MLEIFIAKAHAQEAATPLGSFEPFILLFVFAAVFYFFLWRPQSKKNKAHRELMGSLKPGDEVVTAGGIAGTIRKIGDNNYIVLETDNNTTLKVQKRSIAQSLPKGTIKGI